MKKLLCFIALALSIITLVAPLCSAAEHCAPLYLSAEKEPSLDYTSGEGLAPMAYLSPSDLLMNIISDSRALCEEELDYLDGYFEEYLTYSAAIPDSLVTVTPTQSGVKIEARPYEYTAKNGKRVVFLPNQLTVNGENIVLTQNGGVFEAVLVESAEGAERIRVSYNGSLPLPLPVVNKLLNFAYDEATAALESAEYLAEYNRSLQEYKAYLTALEKYERDLSRYEEYLRAKALYDEAAIAFEKYVVEHAKYLEELKKYEAYKVEYSDYLAKLEVYKTEYSKYEKSYAEYRVYVENVSALRTSLTGMEGIFIDPTNGVRSLYGALQNEELVVMFEKYQGVLTASFGVDKKDIQYMRQYSDRLNDLLEQYNGKREVSEKAAFDFYKVNYNEIKTLFNGLYEKMTKIMTPTIFNLMCGKLELEYGEKGEYKKWRVKNVLCHIHLICMTLDDERTADGKWQFYSNDGDPHTYYYSDLLSQNVIITDENRADPAGLTWKKEVAPPTAPEMPIGPETVEKPIEPLEVKEPTAPEAVSEPTCPETVEEPVLPEVFDRDLLLRSSGIISLLEDDTAPLTRRDELTAEPTVNVALSVEKALTEYTGIAVYTRDGKIDRFADSVSDLPSTLASYSDERTEYEFFNWSLSPVEYVPVPSEGEGVRAVYPLFRASAREYEIVFIADGRRTVKKIAAGEMPDYSDVDLSKASDELYDYEFNGFDNAVRRVSGDATYTACYLETDRIFNVTFVMGPARVVEKWVRESVLTDYPTAPVSYIEGATLYEFTGWDKPLAAVLSDAVYTAIYRETPLADVEGETPTVAEGLYEYTLTVGSETVELGGLLGLAKRGAKAVKVVFGEDGTELFLSADAVKSLAGLKAEKLCISHAENGGIKFVFLDKNGEALSPKGDIRFTFPHGFETDSHVRIRAVYDSGLYSDNVPVKVENGRAQISATANATYRAIRKYTVTVVSAENGDLFADSSYCEEGAKVPLHLFPNTGYVCSAIILRNKETGEETSLDTLDVLTVPAYDAELLAEFTPIKYKITFNYYGGSAVVECALGEVPQPPEINTGFADGGFYHSFIGWSTTVATVTGDATYTAKYFSVSEEFRVEDTGSAVDALVDKFVFPTVKIVVGISVVLIALTIYILKVSGVLDGKKKRKK